MVDEHTGASHSGGGLSKIFGHAAKHALWMAPIMALIAVAPAVTAGVAVNPAKVDMMIVDPKSAIPDLFENFELDLDLTTECGEIGHGGDHNMPGMDHSKHLAPEIPVSDEAADFLGMSNE